MKKLWLHFTYIAGWCLSDMSGLLTGGLVEWLCPFHSKDLTTKLRQSHYVITYKVYTYVYNIFDICVYVSAKWLLLILENSKGVGTSLCPTCISAYHPKIKVATKCVVNCGKFLYVLLEHFSKTLYSSQFLYTVLPWIMARAFISFQQFLTRLLNETDDYYWKKHVLFIICDASNEF